MSREGDFLARWAAEKDAYLAWGRKISADVQTVLASKISPIAPNYFLRTAVVPRTKDDFKLVEKAFFRKKDYADPYGDITDKVGTRFVVLLGSDIKTVEEALTSVDGWSFSKDRDYEAEQKDNPFKFDYAAVHFIVRPSIDQEYDGIVIPAGTPCEVQIKTLLQHAYSELTHDTIYKPQIEATHIMQRNAAKAMALLEATNDYFEKVKQDVDQALGSVRQVTADLSTIYAEFIGAPPRPTVLEGMLLGAYEATANEAYIEDVRELLKDKTYIPERIKERVVNGNPVYAQPSILLAYLAVRNSVRKARADWPLTPAEMEELLNDLGESAN